MVLSDSVGKKDSEGSSLGNNDGSSAESGRVGKGDEVRRLEGPSDGKFDSDGKKLGNWEGTKLGNADGTGVGVGVCEGVGVWAAT